MEVPRFGKWAAIDGNDMVVYLQTGLAGGAVRIDARHAESRMTLRGRLEFGA
jgi:hypothetical protein